MTTNATQARIARDKRVNEVWNEGDDGWWAELKPGWQWWDAHYLHERTLTALKGALRDVKPCACADCRGGAR